MKAVLVRLNDNDHKQTLGRFYLYDGIDQIFACRSLELPDEENQRNISRIPAGRYKVKKRKSDKFGEHFHVTEVPDRDYILIHPGNFYKQIRGCILLGQKFVDINNDGHLDVNMSRNIVNLLLEKSDNTFYLDILDE